MIHPVAKMSYSFQRKTLSALKIQYSALQLITPTDNFWWMSLHKETELKVFSTPTSTQFKQSQSDMIEWN